ncbi:MAG: hypothetical protein ACI4NG_04285 [Candidatus Gallimonas sp.]
MYRYRDYFPRRILRQCGVSPDGAMRLPDQARCTEANRHDEIRRCMSEIYSEFLRGATEQNGRGATLPDHLELDRRILSAFYDMDILQERDRSAFPDDYRIGRSVDAAQSACREERVRIEVAESEEPQAETSPKAEEASAPQRGKTL